jgi:hypothetical protein
MKRPIKRRFVLPLFAALFTATLLLGGCDSGKPDPIFRQTEILRVEVEPSPVPVGDTATFTCVIEDSTDERFEFRWFLDAPTRVTDTNQINWVAEVDTGEYRFRVEVDNGSEDSVSVNRGFTIEVIE